MTQRPPRTDRSPAPLSGAADQSVRRGWGRHPAVRSGRQLPVRERAGDLACRAAGSWGGVVLLVGAAAVATTVAVLSDGRVCAVSTVGLGLSALALVEVWLVLRATRRAERIAAEVALHDLAQSRRTGAVVEEMRGEIDQLRTEFARLVASLEKSFYPPRPGTR